MPSKLIWYLASQRGELFEESGVLSHIRFNTSPLQYEDCPIQSIWSCFEQMSQIEKRDLIDDGHFDIEIESEGEQDQKY